MSSNWMDMFANPKAAVIRNHLLQILGQEKFLKHKDFAERMSATLTTTADIQEFAAVLVAVYENGYFKALNDYREKFKKLGYEVSVTHETAADSR